MAKTSKKPAPTSTSKKWRVYAGSSETDVEAQLLHIEDGTLLFTGHGGGVLAAWNGTDWDHVTLLIEPEPEA